jgi:hypothetical protein
VPARTAAMMPNGIAIRGGTAMAASASSKVAGIRSRMAAVTVWFVRSDDPRSPRTAPFKNEPY